LRQHCVVVAQEIFLVCVLLGFLLVIVFNWRKMGYVGC
jgi:hypothetical protein